MINPMLKSLFSSETRIRILAHFFLNPQKGFYTRQLEKLLFIPVGQISPELHNLENTGLLSSRFEGNQKRYRINRAFPIFDELRSIFIKTAGLVDHIRESLSRLNGIELSFIYGSFAKGEDNEGSDIDIMVVGKVSDSRMSREISGLERKLEREINYSLYTREEIFQRIKQKDNFITSVFKERHILVIGEESDELFHITEG